MKIEQVVKDLLMACPSLKVDRMPSASVRLAQPTHFKGYMLLLRPRYLLLGLELDRNAVDAMADVCGSGKPLVLKDVAQMSPALCANYLNSLHSVTPIYVPLHSTRDLVKEGRPAASGVELLVRPEQRCPAASAVVNAIFIMLVVLSCAGRLSTFLPKHIILFGVQDGLPHILAC